MRYGQINCIERRWVAPITTPTNTYNTQEQTHTHTLYNIFTPSLPLTLLFYSGTYSTTDSIHIRTMSKIEWPHKTFSAFSKGVRGDWKECSPLLCDLNLFEMTHLLFDLEMYAMDIPELTNCGYWTVVSLALAVNSDAMNLHLMLRIRTISCRKLGANRLHSFCHCHCPPAAWRSGWLAMCLDFDLGAECIDWTPGAATGDRHSTGHVLQGPSVSFLGGWWDTGNGGETGGLVFILHFVLVR